MSRQEVVLNAKSPTRFDRMSNKEKSKQLNSTAGKLTYEIKKILNTCL